MYDAGGYGMIAPVGETMDTKMIAAVVVAGVVVIGAVVLLPDFIRYMKIRSM